MRNNVSVIVITKNEESNIRDCLESVKWANEIVVIDSYSTDLTISIAGEYTSNVVQKDWPGMVGIQRNVGLELAKSEWILFLDADERVTSELKNEIITAINSDTEKDFSAVAIPRKNFFFGKWLKSSYPNYTLRLIKKGTGRFNEVPGHGFDTMVVDGATIKFKNPLLHFTGESLAQRVKKLDFDSTLQADEKFRADKKVSGFSIFFHSAMAFIRVYIFKGALLEGTRGFVYAYLSAFNTFLKYAKLWEMRL